MEDITKIMEFNKSILFNGLHGKTPTETEFESAKAAAKRLENQGLFKFDFKDNFSFMRSVANFANSFR